MDLQNVTDLTIQEGEVRAIHDKDGKQLWGRLAYDVKYEGDTTQNVIPTPTTPQNVNVVTGTQTITITDGVVADDFTLELGSTELCKIGNYQDYIYKSGDDWYLHKEIGKVVLKGTEGWNYNSGTAVFYASNVVGYNTNGFIPFSDYFVGQNITSYGQLSDNGVAFLKSTTNNRLVIKYTSLGTNASAIQTWLSNHNTTVYYVPATPTDTQITDSTLISQLEAVHQFLIRYGYNATVSGNLPLMIDKTNL